jgi:microcystin-dependent protein
MTKISGLPEDTAPSSDDWTVSVDNATSSTKKVKWLNLASLFSTTILPLVYPVNSTYIETSGVNPATTFGFGTWVAYAQGQALVGVAATGTFSVAGSAVGSETHALTINEMPSHTHIDAGHTHNGGSGYQYVMNASGGAVGYASGPNGLNASGTTASGQASLSSTGNGAAHSVVQPSMPVYVWKRTA